MTKKIQPPALPTDEIASFHDRCALISSLHHLEPLGGPWTEFHILRVTWAGGAKGCPKLGS